MSLLSGDVYVKYGTMNTCITWIVTIHLTYIRMCIRMCIRVWYTYMCVYVKHDTINTCITWIVTLQLTYIRVYVCVYVYVCIRKALCHKYMYHMDSHFTYNTMRICVCVCVY